MLEQVAEDVTEQAECTTSIERLPKLPADVIDLDLKGANELTSTLKTVELTKPSRSQSVTQTKSTLIIKASRDTCSKSVGCLKACTVTSGFSASIRAFAASTLYQKRKPPVNDNKNPARIESCSTCFPTSSSLKKKPAPKSSSLTSSES